MSNLVKRIRNWSIGLVVAGAITWPAYDYFTPDTVKTTIIDTEVKRYDDDDKYLVNTDYGTLENTDAWYRLKFNSSDIQGQIKKLKGKEVEITKYGWRWPIFSWYENIVDVKEIKK